MSDTIKLPTDHHGAMSMILGAVPVSPPSYEEAIAIYLRARGILNDGSALLGATVPVDWTPEEQKPGWYYRPDDPEYGASDPETFADDAGVNDVVEVQGAGDIGPRIFVTRKVLTVDDAGDADDTEIVQLTDGVIAQDFYENSLKEARKKAGLPEVI